MKYYLIKLSHYCSFKVATDATNINDAVAKWIKIQNAGEPKSDRLIFYGIDKITKVQYDVHHYNDQTYYLTKYLTTI